MLTPEAKGLGDAVQSGTRLAPNASRNDATGFAMASTDYGGYIVGVPHRAPFTAARSAQRIEATPENGHEVLS
jgi:hypothetical protein